MDPRFECAFCGREVRCLEDESSVTFEGKFFFKATGTILSISEKFCKLDCLYWYIRHWYAHEQVEADDRT